MDGARFVHDRLGLAGSQVEIADAQKVKGLAPRAFLKRGCCADLPAVAGSSGRGRE